MLAKFQFVFVLILLSVGYVGCALQSSTAEITIPKLIKNPVKYNGQTVQVRGFVRWQGLGSPLLYATRARALNAPEDEGIDLARSKGRFSIRHYLEGQQGQCMVVKGRFRAYTRNVITVDTTSKYGRITADNITRC